jgi:biuret amidohydrolase
LGERYVQADPYPWPYNGDLRPQNTALIIIDMQTDLCGIGGYVDRTGYDLSLTRAPIEPIKCVLAAMRDRDTGPCGRIPARGEPGWDIIPDRAPRDGEPIIDKVFGAVSDAATFAGAIV